MKQHELRLSIRPLSDPILEACEKKDRPFGRACLSYQILGKDKQVGKISLGADNMKRCTLGVRKPKQNNVSCLAMGPIGKICSACYRPDIYASPEESSS